MYLRISFVLFLCVHTTMQANKSIASLSGRKDNVNAIKYLYFAYGSNMLSTRMHINVPGAIFDGIAVLKNYRLDFTTGKIANGWNGGIATIVPDSDQEVWGVLYKVTKKDFESLDKQEGVHEGVYERKFVNVMQVNGEYVPAQTYIMTGSLDRIKAEEEWPISRKPSITYKKVIVFGAVEADMPFSYISYLSTIPHNGRLAIRRRRDNIHLIDSLKLNVEL